MMGFSLLVPSGKKPRLRITAKARTERLIQYLTQSAAVIRQALKNEVMAESQRYTENLARVKVFFPDRMGLGCEAPATFWQLSIQIKVRLLSIEVSNG